MTYVEVRGPFPPPGREFCTYCMLVYKTAILYANLEKLLELEQDGKTDKTVIWDLKDLEHTVADITRLRWAAGIAPVNGNPSWGFVKVCWVHMLYEPKLLGITEPPPGKPGLAIAHGDVEEVVKQMNQGPMGLIQAARSGQRGL